MAELPGDDRTRHERIQRGTERFKQSASDAVGHTHDTLDHAADKVEKGVHRGADKTAHAAEAVAERASDWTGNVRDYVRENPGRSLVIALAAGWLAGRMMRH